MSKTKNINKPKRHVARYKQKPKTKEEEPKNYYRMYIKEKKERKRLQYINGIIDERVEKVNRENEVIFTQMQINVDYWRFSFFLATTQGVDFLNFEIDLIKKGLMQPLETISDLNKQVDEKK